LLTEIFLKLEWRGKKMRLSKIVIGILLAIALLSLTACGGGNGDSSSDDVISLRLGYGNTVTNPRHLTAEKYAAWVYEQTDGRVQIELFPSEILGTERAMLEMLTMGTLDMTLTSQGPIASYEESFYLIGLPFLFNTPEHAWSVIDGEIGDLIAENLPSRGLRLLAYWENGMRQITNSVRPIESPSDMIGLSIRAPENAMTLSIMDALGASAAPLAFPELYMALAQGAFDGQENPITNIHANNFWEVQDYISIVNYKYETIPFVISEQIWQELPEDVQQVLLEGARKFAQVHREMVRDGENVMLEELEYHGMTISHPNTIPFREASAAAYEYWRVRLGAELVDRIIAEASAAE
jgi:tripartite ATP-independent transporter DctP family solute receptor